LSADACTRTRICPTPGEGVGFSCISRTSGPPGRVMTMAFMSLKISNAFSDALRE
jgi:hypothetical protein